MKKLENNNKIPKAKFLSSDITCFENQMSDRHACMPIPTGPNRACLIVKATYSSPFDNSALTVSK
jgi:hypothetical protein